MQSINLAYAHLFRDKLLHHGVFNFPFHDLSGVYFISCIGLSQSSLNVLRIRGKGLMRITLNEQILQKYRKNRAIRFLRAICVKYFSTLRKP